jgi:hypothetical protein
MSTADPLLFRYGRRGWSCRPDTRPSPPRSKAAVACGNSGPGSASGRAARIAMSTVTAERTPVSTLVAACGRRPATHPRRPTAADTTMAIDTARPRVPDTSRPDGGRSGSSGRSIRQSLRLVTTSSTLAQGRPCGRPPAAAVLGRQTQDQGAAREL